MNKTELLSLFKGKCGFFEDLSTGDLNIAEILDSALRHRVAVMAAGCLQEQINSSFSVKISNQISELEQAQLQRNFQVMSEHLKLHGILGDCDVKFLVMKGLAISNRFYSEPWRREANDIDLLVPQASFETARKALVNAGYIQTRPAFPVTSSNYSMLQYRMSGMDFVHPENGITVELHWRFIQERELMDWDFGVVSKSNETIDINGTEFMVPDVAHQLVYLCCHGAKHGWFRLKWLLDIHFLLQVCDLPTLKSALAIADQYNLSSPFDSALELVDLHFDTNHLIAVRDHRNHVSSAIVQHALAMLESPEPSHGSSSSAIANTIDKIKAVMPLKPSFRYKLAMIGRYMFSPEDIRLLNLSARWLPLYYILGPLLFVGRFLKLAVKRRG